MNTQMNTQRPEPKVGQSVGNRGKGRKRGVPNKITATLKDAILLAATDAGGHEGLVGYLKLQAIKMPQAFLPLLGKVLPLQVGGQMGLVVVPLDQTDMEI